MFALDCTSARIDTRHDVPREDLSICIIRLRCAWRRQLRASPAPGCFPLLFYFIYAVRWLFRTHCHCRPTAINLSVVTSAPCAITLCRRRSALDPAPPCSSSPNRCCATSCPRRGHQHPSSPGTSCIAPCAPRPVLTNLYLMLVHSPRRMLMTHPH